MFSFRNSNLAALTIVAAIGLGAPLIISAQTADEIRAQISSHNGQIEALNREIAEYEKQLKQLGSKRQTLQGTLNQMDIERKQINARIDVLKNSIGTLELEIRQLGGSIVDKEESITESSRGLSQAIVRLRELDDSSLVEQVLGYHTVSDVWTDIETNSTFQDAVVGHIRDLTTIKQELTDTKTATEKKQRELKGQQQDLASQQTSLDINRREQQTLITQTKSEESSYQKLLSDKRAAKIVFEQAMNELESKLQYTLDPSRLPSAGKGVLRWPLDNITVTQKFGNTDFAKSGAYNGSGHNGVDFRASVGTPVKAALAGTVAGTGNTDAIRGCYSYGKWVLIRHGNGLSTLYAHLSQVNVAEGQSIGTSGVIGYSGNTGYSTGPHLHFTVYASNGVRVMRLGDSTGKATPCANASIPVAPFGAYLDPLVYL